MKKIIIPFLMTILLSSCSTIVSPSDDGSTSTSSSTSSSSSSEEHSDGILDFYSINDYHGRIEEDLGKNEAGISRFATYLHSKENENKNGTVFVNAGDLWQDTYSSSKNKGELLTKAMAELRCEAMALGNHEFDWGIENIKHNKQVAETQVANHTFSLLGANIYNYENGSVTTQASDIASPYKIIYRKGYKIGLIGAIGKNQITSITSTNWENLTFLDHVDVVKNVSDELRTKENCDVVVLLFHGAFSNVDATSLSSVSPVSGKHYVDAGFLGHSHAYENQSVDNVPWIQSYHHGVALGHIRLKIDENKNVSCTMQNETEGANIVPTYDEDVNIKNLVSTYLTNDFVAQKESVVANLVSFSKTSIGKEMGYMSAYSTSWLIDELRKSNSKIPQIDIVINNGNRDTIKLNGNTLTIENVFNLIPFTNKTIIARVKGQDIINECVNYSNPYYLPGESALAIDSNSYYNIACIDYLLYHKNTSRNYNYFPSFDGNPIYVVEDYPCDIMIDYLNNHGNSFNMSILNTTPFTGLSAA